MEKKIMNGGKENSVLLCFLPRAVAYLSLSQAFGEAGPKYLKSCRTYRS